jgi:peptidyl-prolyl cis-trans isomerase D
MLKVLRDQFKNLKFILWFVVIIFVLLIFVDWGTGRAGRRGGAAGQMVGVAAKVGSHDITENQFLKELRSTEDRYRQMYGQQWEAVRQQLDLPSMTMQSLVNSYLLTKSAERMGITVSDAELRDKLASLPIFRGPDGGFVGYAKYSQIVRAYLQSSPEEFEAELRDEMAREKLQQVLGAGVVVADASVVEEYKKRNESATFDLLFVATDPNLAGITVSDAEAKAYYDANQARFSHPDQWRLRYLLVDKARLRRTLNVSDQQIVDYYNGHTSEFATSEEVSARHILIKPKGTDEAALKAAEKLAKEVYAKATAQGADFAALARQYSDDEGSKATGGDLGYFSRGRMVKEFEDAVFAGQPGQIVGPVKSQFGYHIIKIEGRRPGGTRPLDQVRESIRLKLVDGLADGEGNRRATALREKIDAAKLSTEEQWKGLADDVVTSNVTPFFGKGEFIPGLGRDPELLTEVTTAKEGFIGGPRRSGRGWIVYRLDATRKAGPTPFDEAKAEAVEAVKRSKAVEKLRAEVEAKKAELAGKPLADLAAALHGKVENVKDHHRGTALPGGGTSKAMDDAVFATLVGGTTPVVAIGDRGVALAHVTALSLMDPTKFAAEKESLRKSMVQEETQNLLYAMLQDARKEFPVVINPEMMERFKAKE